jgi:transposase
MLDEGTRTAVFELRKNGMPIRRISLALSISRGAVREVLASGTVKVPRLERPEKAEPYRDRILELYTRCKGNLVRVHEEIAGEGLSISYPALTSFCRRHGIGVTRKPPAGRYHFDPGQEMQHDTSPHRLPVGGSQRDVQVASLVLCHSRVLFFQYYPCFTRFECKVFLTDALRYVGGSCQHLMIDNTHVIVLRGTGANMVPVPEMEAFAEHFGFAIRAHEKGDANRSARVERPFHYIENNFEAGRTGEDFADWNGQAVAWCDRDNARGRRSLGGASPRELCAAERPLLRPLPGFVPEVYRLHHRTVDNDGYVHVDTNHYSVPLPVGKPVEIRETKDRVVVYDGPRIAADQPRVIGQRNRRVTDPAHRPPRGQGKRTRERQEAAATLLRLAPELEDYVEALGKRGRGPAPLLFRRLLAMVRDYPREPLVAAIGEAAQYGLYDLERVERMVLKRIGEDFFYLTGHGPGEHDG